MKVRDILPAVPAIEKLKKIEGLDIVALYKLNILLKPLNEKIRVYEECRNVLVNKYGTVIPDKPDQIQVLPEKIGPFQEELFKLQDEEVSFEFKKIPLSLVKDIKGLILEDLMGLDPFIEDDVNA